MTAPAVLAHIINAFIEAFVVPSIMDPSTNDNLFIVEEFQKQIGVWHYNVNSALIC
jgi:hypothetical protein